MHAVSEVYVPGSAGDDPESHPTFPVAAGLLKEAEPEEDESAEEFVSKVEDLQTEMEETLLSSSRPNKEHLDNAGGDDIEAENGAEASEPAVPNQDSWVIEGDFLVRKHALPRNKLFSPLDYWTAPKTRLQFRRRASRS